VADLPFFRRANKMVARFPNEPHMKWAYAVAESVFILSEVEGSRSTTVRLLRGIPRLRFAPLGITELK
jgi:hypothetical protein